MSRGGNDAFIAVAMIVTCPACRTRYQVDEQALRRPAGRTVRCAGCGHIWHEAPPIEISRGPAAPTIDAPRLAPLEMPPRPAAVIQPRPPRRSRGWTRTGVIVLIFLLVCAVLAGIVGRGEIVAAWPAAARLYALVGLPVR
ncbi:MAG: zinc-ribbon domain-containing protein [Stellaceae bacterium]